jgi:hypothetical protein
LNFLNFNDIGENALVESNSFKRTKAFFKGHTANNYNSYNYFNTKYKMFTNFVEQEENFANSFNYGIRRQHNFLINQTQYSEATSFNYYSILKFLKFNTNTQISYVNKNLYSNLNFFNLFKTSDLPNYYFLLFFDDKTNVKLNFIKNIFFEDNKLLLNNDSDKKKLHNPLLKTRLINRNLFFNNQLFKKNFNFDHYSTFSYFQNFNNVNKIYKNFDNFSSNQTILTNSKFIRKHLNILPTKSNINLSNNINT